MTALPDTTTSKITAATTQGQLDRLVAGIKQSFAEERRRNEAGAAAIPAATPMNHGTATIQFNGLTVNVGFDIHAETPVDQKEELIRMAAVRCVADFFATYRGGEAGTEEGEAA